MSRRADLERAFAEPDARHGEQIEPDVLDLLKFCKGLALIAEARAGGKHPENQPVAWYPLSQVRECWREMGTRIALRYSGPAVESGQMDVYEVSANMIAFSDFVVLLSKSAFDDTVETRASVAGFGRGSFVTDIVFNVAGACSAVFAALPAVDPKTLWLVLKEALALWKHLKGAPPTKVEDAGPQLSVTNNNGQVIQVTHATVNVVFSEKGTASAHRFIGQALSRHGVDAVEIASSAKEVERVEQAESQYFVSVAPSEMLTNAVVKMVLHLESSVFKEGNKWRFFDGQQSFHAAIDDKEFLAKVDAGEPFRKGDVIVADVRINQTQEGAKLTAERAITKVLEHKERPHQFHFLDPERKS
jgi:hypothetical protein